MGRRHLHSLQSTIMFAVLSLCLVLAAQAFAADVSCDMKDRYPGVCGAGSCCVIEILPVSGPWCRPMPKAGQKCATVENTFFCPCTDGLTCKTETRPDGSRSIYGKCA